MLYIVLIISGTDANVQVVELLTKTMFVNDVAKMSNVGQTSGVEAYHSVVNHFAPKMYKLSYKGMNSRWVKLNLCCSLLLYMLQLAAVYVCRMKILSTSVFSRTLWLCAAPWKDYWTTMVYNTSFHKFLLSRIILAAMHYNENAGRAQKATQSGFNCYSIAYPKYKSGGYSLKKVLVEATYGKCCSNFSMEWNEHGMKWKIVLILQRFSKQETTFQDQLKVSAGIAVT